MLKALLMTTALVLPLAYGSAAQAQLPPGGGPTQGQLPLNKPNILVIMGDDVGWSNIGAYHQGLMYHTTPNLDRLAKDGMRFTDYYAEASCTAGRANFITGELPIRTGMTTVGQAGSAIGFPDAAPTIANALHAQGYATGQFGKNHLGDRNGMLPTAHGFDEYFGYLYHLNAMEDPFWHTYPKAWIANVGPRDLIHSWATDNDDPTEQPRWGKIGKQKIVDEGPLPPGPMPGIKYNMTTFDEVVTQSTIDFMGKAKAANKPFFVWMNPTRAHVLTHLSPKYEAMRNEDTGWGEEEAAMKQMDDNIGVVLQWVKDQGLESNTIVVFTTDNGAETFTWPDGGNTPFAGSKGMVMDGGYRVPAIIKWPGHVPADTVSSGLMSGLDWFPTLTSIAGNPNVKDQLLKGLSLDGKNYKVHLDGYDQTPLITGKGPTNRHELWYFAQTRLGAVRVDDWKYSFLTQPNGWFGVTERPNIPAITNLRQDPYERMNWPSNGTANGSVGYWDSFKHEMWRFQVVSQVIGENIPSFVEYPPMQEGAGFSTGDLKEKVQSAIAAAHSSGD
jgi:arylsulfatase A-like enzyme